MKKRMICLLLAACMLTTAGCGKKKEESVKEQEVEVKEEVETPEPEPVVKEEKPEDTHEGKAKSYLTGEWIDQDLAKKGPLRS